MPEIDEIACDRKTDEVACGVKIPLVPENLRVFNQNGPVLSAVCSKCSKNVLLGKVLSKALIDKYFGGVCPSKEDLAKGAGAHMEDDDLTGGGDGITPEGGEGEGGKEESTPEGTEPPVSRRAGKQPTGEPVLPGNSLVDIVMRTLDVFGYKGPKWKDKRDLISEMIAQVSTYQTPQGLHNLLMTTGIPTAHIPLIVTRAFGGMDSAQAMQPGMYSMMPQYAGQGTPFPFPQMMPPGISGGMPMVQQLPNGQLIILQPPAITQREGGQRVFEAAPDREMVEEIMDKDGRVTRRILHGAHARPAAESGTDQLVKTLITLKELGLFGAKDREGAGTDDKFATLTLAIQQEIAALAQMQKPQGANEEVVALRQKLEDERESRQKDHDQKIIDEIARLHNAIENVAAERRGGRGAPEPGLSDPQFELDTKRRNFETLTVSVENMGSRLIEPLVDMNKAQMRLNTMMLVRQMELQDAVAPGTYMAAMGTIAPPTDDEVEERKRKWKERQGAATRHGGEKK